ncbi:hypothetical protein ACIQMJ_40755 [Actinosynnema sp. NPDC091369]
MADFGFGDEEVLDALGVSARALRGQADFHAAYAVALSRARPSDPVWGALVSRDDPWRSAALRASAYRMAAQYAALVDPTAAARLAFRASIAYLEAGLPFGAMVAVGLMGRRAAVTGALVDRIRAMTTGFSALDPVQRVYLLLTLVGHPVLADNFESAVPDVARNLAAHGLHPVGAHGVPLADHFELALALFRTGRRPDLVAPVDDVEGPEVFDHLVAIGRRRAAALRVAQGNDYLWRNAAAPVDLVDLEEVSMTGLILNRLGGRRWLDSAIREEEPLVRIPLLVAQGLRSALADARVFDSEPFGPQRFSEGENGEDVH